MLGLNRQLLELSHLNDIALYVKDASGRYSFINESGARMLNLTPKEVVGQNDFALFKKASAEFIVRRDHAITTTKAPSFLDYVAETQAGWRRFHSAKLRIQSGSESGFGILGLSADVTKIRDARLTELVHFLAEQYVATPQLTLPSGFSN